jgi:hypothetical protein
MLRRNLQAAVAKYMVQKELTKVLSLTHAQELLAAPRNEWPMIRSKQIDEIKAVKSGEQFDIVDRRSWCFSSDTEVLTRRGWIKWPEVKKSDLFATRTKDGNLEYHSARRLIKHWYKGNLLLFQNQGANFLVTPNHRLLGRMRNGVRGKFSEIDFYLAEEVAKLKRQDPKADTCLFRVPVTSKWTGKRPPKYYMLSADESTAANAKTYRFSSEDFIAFLGIFVAEGSCTGTFAGMKRFRSESSVPLYKQAIRVDRIAASADLDIKSYDVVISQSENSKYYDDIAGLLTRMGIKFQYKKNVGFNFTSRVLHQWLFELGNSYTMGVPDFVKDLDSESIKTFITWALKGDGYYNKYNGGRIYKTVSPRLADDMQELFQKAGMNAVLIPDYDEEGKHRDKTAEFGGNTKNVRNIAPMYIVYETSRKEIGVELKMEVPYNDWVYCAEVPNHTLLVRRSGKAVWSGNSYPYLPEALHRLNQPILKSTPYNLRRFSETPIPRRAINLIKNAVLALKWEVAPTTEDDAGTDPDKELRIQIATECLKRPNNIDGFRECFEAFLEDFLIGGYGTLEPRMTPYFQRPFKVWPVDGSTVRIFMDWTESTPDRPRFAQMTGLKGERGIVTFLDSELIYIRDNVRTSTPFGLGKLEVAFQSVNAFLGIQDMAGKSGSDQVHKTWLWWSSTLNPAHIQTVRRHITNEIEGQAKVSLMAGAPKPEVVEVTPVTPEDLLLDWQRFLIDIIAAGFDLSPMALGQTDKVNKATGQVMADSDFRSSVVPTAKRLEEAITRHLLHSFLGWKDLEFRFIDLEDPDALTRTIIQQRQYMMNAITPDEIRKKNNQPPLPAGWGKLTQAQMQILLADAMAKMTGKAMGSGMGMGSSGGGGGGMGSMSSGMGAGMGMGSSGMSSSLGSGSMNFSANDVASMTPDQIQLFQEYGLLPDTAELGQQMEQQQPGILETLSTELQQFLQTAETIDVENEQEEAPITPQDEQAQLQRYYQSEHAEDLAEKSINRRGVFGPSINQQIRKAPERGKYPRSGARFEQDQMTDPTGGGKILNPKGPYRRGKNNPYKQ